VGEAERSRDRLEQGLAFARHLGDDVTVARSLEVLGLLAFFENDIGRARELFEESVEVARKAGDRWSLADALGTLGSIYPLQGEFGRAEAVAWEAAAIARTFGDRQGIRMANFALALTAARRGELSTARSLSEEGLAICREIGDLWFVSYFLWILSTTAANSGDYGAARTHAEESLKIARELEGPLLIVCALDAMAVVARAEGDDEAARQHLVEAVEVGRSTIVPASYVASVLTGLGELAVAGGELSEAEACIEESLSRAHGVDDRWAAARALAAQATLAERRGERDRARAIAGKALELQIEMGDQLGAVATVERLALVITPDEAEHAARLLGAVSAERERLGAPLSSWEQSAREDAVTVLRSALGDAQYEASAHAGREMSLESAAKATTAPS
jgi:tetratricopeptide (TPR) repeat protein